MNIATLIFSLGVLNLMLALVVFIDRYTARQDGPELRLGHAVSSAAQELAAQDGLGGKILMPLKRRL